MRKDVPLAVEVPSPERDKPAWVKVGVIAAVGFIVGIAWPRLVGVRLGPSAPGEAAAAASASGGTAGRAPDAPPGSAGAKTNGVPMATGASEERLTLRSEPLQLSTGLEVAVPVHFGPEKKSTFVPQLADGGDA